jgi:prepilin-type N-terminal cleavage/methylation domain-containing protein
MAKTKSNGFSLIELLIVVAIILLIAAIAVPHLIRSKMAANESAAVAVLRNLNNSQGAYSTLYSSVGYAQSLAKLGPGSPCDSTHACLADELIGCAAEPCRKSGYGFYSISAESAAPFIDYTFTATPLVWGSSGERNYCTTEDALLREQLGGAAILTTAVDHITCVTPSVYGGIR